MTCHQPYHPMNLHPWISSVTATGHRASVPIGTWCSGSTLSYRALAPNGSGGAHWMHTATTLHLWGRRWLLARSTANYSLLTANSSYTFSAKEKDPETGLSYFGSRYYSSDLSVWLSVDPMAAKYPSLSPYVYCADNPVKLVDPNGDTLKLPPGTSPEFQKQFKAAIDYLNTNKAGGIASYLHKSKITYYIKETSDNNSGFVTGESTIYWNPNVGVFTDNGVVLSPTTVLNHEFGHALVYDLAYLAGKMKEYYADSEKDSDPNYGTKNDMYVITRIEQRTAKALGEIEKGQVTRTNHSGTFVITKGVTSNEVVK